MTATQEEARVVDVPEHHEPYDPVGFTPAEWGTIYKALAAHAERLETCARRTPANTQLMPAAVRCRELARRVMMARVWSRDCCEDVPEDEEGK